MALVSELELPGFDYTDPSLRGERFHEAMRELRARGWLASGPYGYIVLDREAGEFFLRTRDAIFPGMTIAEIFGVREGPLYEQMRRNILHVNGPDHTRLRSLVNPALSARAVERYRPAMRGFLEGLFADACASAAERGRRSWSVRVRRGVRQAVPVADDRARDGRADRGRAAAAPLVELDPAPVRRGRHGQRARRDRAGGARVLRVRRSARGGAAAGPGDDLISMLIAAEEAGDKLDDVECINLVFNVLVGGVDTTQSQLAHAIRLLAEHPEQWELLRERPGAGRAGGRGGAAVRADHAVHGADPTAEVTFRDVTFPEGTVVMVCAFTGNRDLDAQGEASPEEFDIAADRARARALTFGAGVHYCLGANLARLELREALTFMAERMHGLELDGEVEYETIMGIYGLARLPIKFSV